MRVLTLDDEEWRQEVFARCYAKDDLIQVYTADKAKKALLTGQFDLVCLDHDLGFGRGNGYEVAQFIAALPPAQQPKEVLVHSFNIAAAVRMVGILRDAGIETYMQPFDYKWGNK